MTRTKKRKIPFNLYLDYRIAYEAERLAKAELNVILKEKAVLEKELEVVQLKLQACYKVGREQNEVVQEAEADYTDAVSAIEKKIGRPLAGCDEICAETLTVSWKG